MHLLDLDDKVAAAAIAAAGTVIGAIIQLKIAWRKEMSERARGAPVTKKTRRGPVVAVGLLLVAAAVGGFALSQYFIARSDRESAAVRGELQSQLQQINATAERLERATMHDGEAAGRAQDGRTGVETVAVAATVEPCHARADAGHDAPAECSEAEAVRVTLCTSVRSSSVVTNTLLYARPDESHQPWDDSRVAAGQDLGHARFPDEPFERPDAEQMKQVCANFNSWDSGKSYSARLVVKYINVAGSELSSASLVPTSGVAR